MPIKKSAKHGKQNTALCINCKDVVLTMPSARFTMLPDRGSPADVGPAHFLIATCIDCGYSEFYRDGFLFSLQREGV